MSLSTWIGAFGGTATTSPGQASGPPDDEPELDPLDEDEEDDRPPDELEDSPPGQAVLPSIAHSDS